MDRTAVGGNGKRAPGAPAHERQAGPNRVAFYTRISTDEDHQKYSLGAQAERLEAFSKASWGDDWRLHKVFRDTESGTHMNRPGLEEMLFDAEAQAFDTLLVFRVDRLSRKVRELALMVDELTKHGVVLKSITEPFDTANAAGKMMLQMLGVFAEFEHATIVERTKVGMEKKAKCGRFVGGNVPFGYRLDPEKGLVVREDEALIVRKLFRMYAIGKVGSSAICKDFNETGIRNRNGRKWGRRVALYMLKNPVYLGKIRWREILYDGTHEPLVSEELFQKAQEVLAEREEDMRGRRFRSGDERLLTGVIRCAKCGSHMFGSSGRKDGVAFTYYVCSKRSNYQECDQDYVRSDHLDGAVIQDIKAMFGDEQFMARVWEEANKRLAAERPDIEKEIDASFAEAAKVQSAMDRYFKAFEAGKLEASLCNEKVKALRAQLDELEASRKDLEARRETLELPAIDRQMLASLLGEFEKMLATGTGAQKKDLLHRLVKKVLVHDRWTVEVWYALPNRGGLAISNNWLPKRNSFRTRRDGPPEVWFRILHIAPDGHNTFTEADLIEQTVEIALGPKGAFENGSVGTLTRRVTTDRVVNTAVKSRRPAKPPRQPRTPRVIELLRRAQEWRRQIDAGEVETQAEIARREGITRARVTQIMAMLRLAPEIRECILSMPKVECRRTITERTLRTIVPIKDPVDQILSFRNAAAMAGNSLVEDIL